MSHSKYLDKMAAENPICYDQPVDFSSKEEFLDELSYFLNFINCGALEDTKSLKLLKEQSILLKKLQDVRLDENGNLYMVVDNNYYEFSVSRKEDFKIAEPHTFDKVSNDVEVDDPKLPWYKEFALKHALNWAMDSFKEYK